MVKTVLQNMAALIASLFVSLLLLAGIEWIGAIIYPFPADFGGTSEEMMQYVANYPAWVLALLGGLGWAVTMLTATWLATRFSSGRHPAYGTGVGLLLLAAAIFNMAMLPYPIWYWIANFLLLPAGIYLGVKLGVNAASDAIEPGA